MKLFRYCCGCIGFAHENERTSPHGGNTVLGDALLVRTCEDDEYGLQLRTVDVARFYNNGQPYEEDGYTRELTPELVEHHIAVLRAYIGKGYKFDAIRELLGIRN